jgi:crotonobetainyl-CoA:carnitine CoA-transferase CaiB-like acyl-CoA transferase
LADDPRFATNPDRVTNRPALLPLLAAPLLRRTVAEWCAELWAAGVPAGPVNTLDQVFADPQVLHCAMRQTIAHPTAGTYEAVGIPVKLRGSPGSIRRSPPLLGEHCAAILAVLGYSAGDIAALFTDKIAWQRPASVTGDCASVGEGE